MGRTTMSDAEMRAHLANGRTVLVSPVYGKDEDGNYVEKEPGKHITHPSQLPGSLEQAGDDPAKLARVRAEAKAQADAAQKHLADVERAEAEAQAKKPEPAPAPAPAPAPVPEPAKPLPIPEPAPAKSEKAK